MPSRVVLVILAGVLCLNAQTFQGGVRGRVTDQGGAVVPLAMLTLVV